MRIKIDPEFSGLLRKLTDDERNLLEESLVDDPSKIILTVWKETSILIDGQHRYDICKRKKLKWKVHAKSFPDRDSAKLWVWMHAAGQRNLTDVERREIVGLVYQTRKKMIGRPPRADDAEASENAGKTSAENAATVAALSSRTAGEVAKEFDVSERSVYSADEWATALANVHNAIADGVRTKKISASLEDLKKFAELDTDAKRPIVALAKRGELKSLKEAMNPKPEKPKETKPKKERPEGLPSDKAFTSCLVALGKVEATLKEVCNTEAGTFLAERWGEVQHDLTNLHQGIKMTAPHKLCPYCKGGGCQAVAKEKTPCRGTGWVPRGVQGGK